MSVPDPKLSLKFVGIDYFNQFDPQTVRTSSFDSPLDFSPLPFYRLVVLDPEQALNFSANGGEKPRVI